MHKTGGSDEYGVYNVKERWIDAWDKGPLSTYVPGFGICELRSYEDGSVRVHYGDPIYIDKNRKLAFVHKMYLEAQKELFLAVDIMQSCPDPNLDTNSFR